MNKSRRHILLLAVALLSFGFVSSASADDPIQQMLSQHMAPGGGNLTVMSDKISAVLTGMEALALKLYQLLSPEAKAVFVAILFPILVAEVSFTGIRIMTRAPVIDQLTKLTVTTFILIVLWTGYPMNIINQGRKALGNSGRAVGHALIVQLVTNSDAQKNDPNVQGLPMEPVGYWLAWIGKPQGVGEDLKNTSRNYKFSGYFLLRHIWGQNDGQIAKETQTPPATLGQQINDALQGMAAVFLPIQMFMMAVTIAGIQVGGVMASVFATLSILVGSTFAFYIVLTIGFATLPLMYFSSFNKIWAQYLTTLAALALVPFFFYLFSAIGFIFSTNLFALLFPEQGQGLAMMLNDVFTSAVAAIYSTTSTMMSGILGFLSPLIGPILAIFLHLGYIGLASSIITVFIFGGVSFSTLAVNAAFRWNQAFASEEMLGKINEFFTGLQGSIGTGLGSLYGEGMQKGAGLAGGLLRGARGR